MKVSVRVFAVVGVVAVLIGVLAAGFGLATDMTGSIVAGMCAVACGCSCLNVASRRANGGGR